MRACTLSGGPSLRRKSRIIPTAFSAVPRSTPTLATRRPTNSSMTPHPRTCGGLKSILNTDFGDDKRGYVAFVASATAMQHSTDVRNWICRMTDCVDERRQQVPVDTWTVEVI